MHDASTRTCCVWVPDWPVVVARRADATLCERAVAVLEPPGSARSGSVRSSSGEARAEGAVPGLRRREAEARCPGVAVLDADVAAEARVFEVLARAIERLTPRVELERPGRLSFPTRGPSRYFGGDDALVALVRTTVADAGLGDVPVRVGIADSRFAARLAARRELVVAPEATRDFLDPWPVRVLGDPDLADLLARLGLRTLGAFAALPPPAVLARFGPDGHRAHRVARGLDLQPPALQPPPPELVEVHELDPPAARVDVATFAAKTMADRLLGALAARGLGCTQVLVEAETEHGEQLARRWRHERALTPAALAERVRWQLEGWLASGGGGARDEELAAADAVTGGLTLLRLVPEEVVAATGRQLGFWGGDAAAADRAARTFARVQGLLGPDAVVSPVVQGGRTPGERVRWVPWGEPRTAVADVTAPWPGAVPSPAPARVLEPAVPAEVLDDAGVPVRVSGRGDPSGEPAMVRSGALPGGGGPVVAWTGPWVHDVRWWDGATRRREARWQVVVRTDGVDVACLVALGRGRATVEAVYD